MHALAALPGVGPALATRLTDRFGSIEAAWRILQEADLESLEAVDGVSARKAVDLCRAAQGLDSDEALLATPAARRVHEEVMARLLSYASTPGGRHRLRLLGPLPDEAAAARSAEHAMQCAAAVADLDRPALRRLLRRVRPLAPPPPRFDPLRLVVAGDDETEDRLHALGVARWCQLSGPAGLRAAEEHDVVVVVGADVDGGPDHVVHVPERAGLADVCPDAVLAWAQANRASIEATAELRRLRGLPSAAPEALAAAAPEARASVALRDAIDAVRRDLEPELRARVAALSLTGEDVLAALGRRLPAALQRVLDDVLLTARQRLRAATGLDVQPFLPGVPLEVDEEAVARLEARLEARRATDAFAAKQQAARAVARVQERLDDEVKEALAFDMPLALGSFVLDHGLSPARFGSRLRLRDSVHLALATDAAATRITYELGGDAPVALLTGANSGGKSTILEHLAQVVTMARMGLPVVGDVEVPWADEVHLVTARKGLDAGAFETFLRGFMPLCTPSGANRLVLVDEVEAVTELEAAARILGFFVRRLVESGTLGVVVTHMGPQVLAHAGPVRVDGIEATGLDEEDRLVVDRRPVMGRFARSTPELIVERLARTTGDALYGDLLTELREGHK